MGHCIAPAVHKINSSPGITALYRATFTYITSTVALLMMEGVAKQEIGGAAAAKDGWEMGVGREAVHKGLREGLEFVSTLLELYLTFITWAQFDLTSN